MFIGTTGIELHGFKEKKKKKVSMDKIGSALISTNNNEEEVVYILVTYVINSSVCSML